jgi:hypothetical protein
MDPNPWQPIAANRQLVERSIRTKPQASLPAAELQHTCNSAATLNFPTNKYLPAAASQPANSTTMRLQQSNRSHDRCAQRPKRRR